MVPGGVEKGKRASVHAVVFSGVTAGERRICAVRQISAKLHTKAATEDAVLIAAVMKGSHS
jgi:hypothetical protein